MKSTRDKHHQLQAQGIEVRQDPNASRDAHLFFLAGRRVASVRGINRWTLALVEEKNELYEWLRKRRLLGHYALPLRHKLRCRAIRRALRRALPLAQLRPLYYAGVTMEQIAAEFDVPWEVVGWAIRLYVMLEKLDEWPA